VPAPRVLVDTGPLVAWFDRADRHHQACAKVWRTLAGPVETVLPVITEALHLLDFSSRARDALFDLVTQGALLLDEVAVDDLSRIRELVAKYADLPLDFADACLVRVAEREQIRTVFTLDRRGFGVVAPEHIRRFRLLPALSNGL
jgi:predicted nucleic acid-binding protein